MITADGPVLIIPLPAVAVVSIIPTDCKIGLTSKLRPDINAVGTSGGNGDSWRRR